MVVIVAIEFQTISTLIHILLLLQSSLLSNALPNDIQLWPNGVIPFVIDTPLRKQLLLCG